MNQNVKRPSLSEEAVSRLIDPRTGQRLRPLGVVGGRAVYPIMGASPDDPSNEDDEGKPDEETNPEGGESSEDKGQGGNAQAKIAALQEEKDRHVRRRREAEAELEKAQARLAELEGKDLGETEKLQGRVTALESENSALQESLRTARLENAFLSDNTFEWHNPRRALDLADLSEVEIDSDGTVHGLSAALKKLAKSDAYLLKTKSKSNEEEEELPSTGDAKNPPRNATKKQQEADAAIVKKYSALQR